MSPESADPAPAPPVGPQRQAIDKIRETARWLILAFAAIGAAIAGSAPLSNLGKLQIGDWRLWVAAAAAAIGLLAIATAIWVTADVLAPVTTALPSLVADDDLRAVFDANPELLRGHGYTLSEFKNEYDEARKAHIEAAKTLRSKPTKKAAAAEKSARGKLLEMSPVVGRIVSEGLLVTVRRRFRRTQSFMFGGALVAGLAIVAFGWAANPPAPKEEKASKKVVTTTTPVLGRLGKSAHGPGVTITRRDAIRLLRAHGINPKRARSFIESFSGAIEIRTVRRPTRFLRFASKASGRGRFLTTSRFSDAATARVALHLPWTNVATCMQRVSVRKSALVLVGGISQGKPGVPQILVLDQKAFSFPKGRAYTRQPCPAK